LDLNHQDASATKPRHRSILSSHESTVCLVTGIAVLLGGVAAVAFGFIIQSKREAEIESRLREIRAVVPLLSYSVQSALHADQLPALQQLIVETSQRYALGRCRVVMPKGQVVADSDPKQITHENLPPKWTHELGQTLTESLEPNQITLRYPLTIAGRGTAVLEVSAPIPGMPWDGWQSFAWVGGIVATGLGVGLLGYVFARGRMRVMGVIRSALLDYNNQELPIEALSVAHNYGPEAVAWNKLLAQTQQLHDQKLVEQVSTAQKSSPRGTGDLDEACNAMPQGLILIRNTLDTHYANGAAAAFAGADRHEMIGKPINQFIQDPQVLDAIQKAADGTSRQRSVIEVEKPGEAGPTVLRISVRPVRRDDPAAVMILVEDITQQRVAEQSRNHFVAQVAHELRAPLSNIRLYVESLLEDGDDLIQRSLSINVINLETKRLVRLVSDMLSVAEIEAGSMEINRDSIQLDEMFEELRADYQPQANEKDITLTLTLPPKIPVIQADRDKLMMALHNLVSNAIKYTPNGEKVDINVSVDADRITVEVRDTGIGISETDQAKIFEKFYRAHDEQLANIPGTGLGLSLAREVVRLHGGDITVESMHGKGSTFLLLLPSQEEAA